MSFLQKVGNYYINIQEVSYIEITEQKEMITFYNAGQTQKVSVLFYLKGKVEPLTIRVNTIQEAHQGIQSILASIRAIR
jgi:hypothetical protein